MTARRLVGALWRGRGAWLTPLIAATLAVVPALGWSVPDERGVPFAVAWAAVVSAAVVALTGARRSRRRRPRPGRSSGSPRPS